MTDQPYTPTTEEVRRGYSKLIARQRGSYSSICDEFDRWLAERDARIEAAAEQRGELRGKMEGFDEGIEHLSTYGYITIEVHDMALSENPYRADQMEGDDV